MAGDTIASHLVCGQCGICFQRKSTRGRIPARCQECAEVRKKQQVRDACAVLRDQGYFRARWRALPKWDRPAGQCAVCGSSFTPHVPYQRYCAKECRAKADSRRASDVRPLYRYARWLRIRREQLGREPWCKFCRMASIETPATVCDHVQPHRGDIDAFWSGPFQSLCVECHNRDKQRLERRAA